MCQALDPPNVSTFWLRLPTIPSSFLCQQQREGTETEASIYRQSVRHAALRLSPPPVRGENGIVSVEVKSRRHREGRGEALRQQNVSLVSVRHSVASLETHKKTCVSQLGIMVHTLSPTLRSRGYLKVRGQPGLPRRQNKINKQINNNRAGCGEKHL